MKQYLAYMCVGACLALPSFSFSAEKGDYYLNALKFCRPGDTCVAIKSSCETYDAVNARYLQKAKAYYKQNAERADCLSYTPKNRLPVATCSKDGSLCTLTPVESYIIDPRMKVSP